MIDTKLYRSISILEYLDYYGYSTEYRNVEGGYILKVCPLCGKKDHLQVNTHDNSLYSHNRCFQGDIIQLHMQLRNITHMRTATNELSKIFNINDNYVRQNKRINTLSNDVKTENLENILNKEIERFMIEITKIYKKYPDFISEIMNHLLSLKTLEQKFHYIEYLKLRKRKVN